MYNIYVGESFLPFSQQNLLDPDPPDDDFESPTTDVKVQAIKTRLETLTDEANDLEKLWRLFDEVYNGHLETREQIGDLVRQFL